jgi:RNA polymerase sigma factor for flagellar operon FliA
LKSRAFNHKTQYPDLNAPAFQPSQSPSREEMILQYTPLIKYIAHRLAMRLPPHISADDLFGAGAIGLMDALDKFDPKKKVQFKTYAEFRIKGAMLDELRSLD